MLLSLYLYVILEEWKSHILFDIRFLLSIPLKIRLLNHSSLWSDVLFSVEEVGVGKWESTAYLYPFYPSSTAYLARAGPERRLGYTRVLTWFGMHDFSDDEYLPIHTANHFWFTVCITKRDIRNYVFCNTVLYIYTVAAIIQLSLLWTTYELWKGIMKLK